MMKRRRESHFFIAIMFLFAFVLWTVLVCVADVRAIGPCGSSVGLATLNEYVHGLTGVHLTLYTITDWLGLVPVAVAFGFAALGLVQWIKRKSILKADRSLLVLGGLYMIVAAIYVFFETVAINYRPVLINDCLEASYPSSTTMLVMCVMPTARMQLNARIKNKMFRRGISHAIALFIAFMVVGRLISGVHWVSDIIGGALISTGFVMMYASICEELFAKKVP